MATKKKLGSSKRKRKISRVQDKMGKPPGTVTYLGNKEKSSSHVIITEYNQHELRLIETTDIKEIETSKDDQLTSWINVIGINDEHFIASLGKTLHLNPLVMEDAINTDQRPKIDEYEDYIFGVFKMLYLNDNDDIVSEHLAMVLFKNAVVVFQEETKDVFDGVRSRLRSNLGRIRGNGSDYLFFALLDAIIDNYFLVLEQIGHRIDELEEEVYLNPNPEVAQNIQTLKKDILKIRKYIFPVKELINRLIDSESPLIQKDTKLFFKDALDHAVEINEMLQIYREMSMSLVEMYMSNMSNKMNEVMKVLTIMSSIFIPLSFIAGVYGMNFDNMPELHWKNGYFIIWGIMLLIVIGLLIYFKRKKWL